MASHTSTSNLNTSQRCCSHCNSVNHTTSSTRSRKIRVPYCRNDRQHPLTLSSYRHHCQGRDTEIKATRSPSEMSRCLSQETTTNNISPQKGSHFTTVNPISSMDTSLITDIAIDGHNSFHTTLQVITSQGSKPLHIKVDPGASCSSIPLSYFHKTFPKYFTKSGALKKTALKPTWMTWSAHNRMCQNFLGYIVLDI